MCPPTSITAGKKIQAKLLVMTLNFTAGEVPSAKLAALQRVLQSEFLTAVREVYEHVYETVDISGSPEIRASATAKVCGPWCSCYSWPIFGLFFTSLFSSFISKIYICMYGWI